MCTQLFLWIWVYMKGTMFTCSLGLSQQQLMLTTLPSGDCHCSGIWSDDRQCGHSRTSTLGKIEPRMSHETNREIKRMGWWSTNPGLSRQSSPSCSNTFSTSLRSTRGLRYGTVSGSKVTDGP
ncbi:unnamed protein product, partial [Ixodes hexagonus]